MKRWRRAALTVGMPSMLGMLVAMAALPLGAQRPSKAGTVVTDTLWSQSLGAKKSVVLYLPPSYALSRARRYPVAYYLHGLGGRETDWTQRGMLAQTMDSLVAAGGPEMIIVMPDGDDSWYTTWNTLLDVSVCRRNPPETGESVDTYCVPWPHYDDYIARDLVQFTDKKYRTQAERAHRAIGGLSMGGYGAMSLSLGYPEVFSAAASHAGVLSPLFGGPKPFTGETPAWALDGASLEKRWDGYWPIGPAFGKDTAAWWSRDPGRRLEKLVARKGKRAVPALFVDCGTEDNLIDDNRVFRWVAAKNGVPVTYHEWPGEHSWAYGRAHLPASLSWIGARIAP